MPTAQFPVHVSFLGKISLKLERKEKYSNYQVAGAESIRRSHSLSLSQNNVGGGTSSPQTAARDAKPQFSFLPY